MGSFNIKLKPILAGLVYQSKLDTIYNNIGPVIGPFYLGNKMIKRIYEWVLDFISNTTWRTLRKFIYGKAYNLTWFDCQRIKDILSSGYYIILTADKSHLSSWSVKAVHRIMTGKKAEYSHALVNVEADQKSYAYSDFKFVEAIGTGVKYSNWDQIFNCDSVCILKPKYYTTEEFNTAVEDVYTLVGRKYDKYFKLNDTHEMSCVEIARFRLQKLPEYNIRMRVFEYMISNFKNLTPQMFRDCPDFEVLLEIKR